jgi:23S rRNA (uracil1939-C5)-methyltransferase
MKKVSGTFFGAAPAPAPSRAVKVTVSEMSLEGDGMAMLGAQRLLVPGTISGEEIEVELDARGRVPLRGRLIAVVKASPHRVAPLCPYFGPCGACTWQHIAYPEQLRLKEKLLRALLARALGGEPPVRRAVGLESPWGFRNKAHFVIGKGPGGELAIGHFAARSKELVAVESCPVHHDAGNRVAFRVRDALRLHGAAPVERDRPASGAARHLVVRASESSGQTQAVLVGTRKKIRDLQAIAAEVAGGTDAATGFHLSVNDDPGPFILGGATRRIAGRERLLEEVAGVRFLISPGAFFQTSARAAENLAAQVIGAVERAGAERVLDLYAGIGLFALPLAKRGRRVLAVEQSAGAVRDGIASARWNRIHGCRFRRERVEAAMRRLAAEDGFDAVILDPPREGCPERVLGGICREVRPRTVIYVSCDPRSLARDLRALRKGGYALEEATPVDMFPHTAHIETVAVLSASGRRARDGSI